MFEAAIQFPNLDPVALSLGPVELGTLTLGPFQLRWYALAYIAGLLLGWRYIVSLLRTERLWAPAKAPMSAQDADDLLFWATLGVIIGGRLGYVLFYKPDMLWLSPLEVPALWRGGMSFHGGLIGVGLALLWFSRTRKTPLLTVFDVAAAATPIGLCFGRIANFINGELWGRPTTAPWGVIFPGAGPAPRHPSQLYESLLEGLVLFIVLRIATHSFDSLKRPGLTAGIFLVGYGLVRASLEQVREPDAHMPEALRGYVTMGLLLSLPMILGGAWLIRRALRLPPPASA
ncbi:MAG: prolipoprotein diacylglyceryl transferase [Hyphomonadaceae bacterium]|nr:prolipoprotein diacylglyceryl transferase [Hyphomonadaceae bacterium]